MSLTRIAIRLSALAALKASPALAGTDIFDSSWSAIDRIGEETYRPVIVVSTEDVLVDENEVRFQTNRRVDMLVQISLTTVDGAVAEIAPDDWDTAEILLDLLEQEVDWALEGNPTWSGLVQHVDKNSTTVRDVSGAAKMPVRLLVLSARVFEIEQQPPTIAPETPPAGLDRFGETVAALARALPPGHRVRSVLENAAALTLAQQVQRLARVEITARPKLADPPETDDEQTVVFGVDLPAPDPSP